MVLRLPLSVLIRSDVKYLEMRKKEKKLSTKSWVTKYGMIFLNLIFCYNILHTFSLGHAMEYQDFFIYKRNTVVHFFL